MWRSIRFSVNYCSWRIKQVDCRAALFCLNLSRQRSIAIYVYRNSLVDAWFPHLLQNWFWWLEFCDSRLLSSYILAAQEFSIAHLEVQVKDIQDYMRIDSVADFVFECTTTYLCDLHVLPTKLNVMNYDVVLISYCLEFRTPTTQWTGRSGCELQLNWLSLKNTWLTFIKTWGKLQIMFEEFIECTSNCV